MSGDGAITADLMVRLRRHYIKPGMPLPGGVFLPEVGWNGSGGVSRCDAIYVGFTGASGRLLVGHEVKASRSDWLAELNKPGKADSWADECHEWWLVTAPGIVREGELPDGWGHMVPGTSATRMKVLVPAARRRLVPSWNAVRSIIARQDTLRAQAICAAQSKASNEAFAELEQKVKAQVEQRMARSRTPDAAVMWDELTRYRTALGGVLVGGEAQWFDSDHGEQDLVQLAALLRAKRSLVQAMEGLVGRYSPISSLRDRFEQLEKAMVKAVAEVEGGS